MGCKQSKSYDIQQPDSDGSVNVARSNGSQRFSGTTALRDSSYVNTGYKVDHQDQDFQTRDIQPYDSGLPDVLSLEKEDRYENAFSENSNSKMKLEIQHVCEEPGVICPPEAVSPDTGENKSHGNDGMVETAEAGNVINTQNQFESVTDRDVDRPLSVKPNGIEHESVSDGQGGEEGNMMHHTTHHVTDDDGKASDISSTGSITMEEEKEHTSVCTADAVYTEQDMHTEIKLEPLKTLTLMGTCSLPEIVVEMHEDVQDIPDPIHHTADLEYGTDTTSHASASEQTLPPEVGDSNSYGELRLEFPGEPSDKDSVHSSVQSDDTAEGNIANVFHDLLQYSEESMADTGRDERETTYDLEQYDVGLNDTDMFPPPEGFSVVKVA